MLGNKKWMLSAHLSFGERTVIVSQAGFYVVAGCHQNSRSGLIHSRDESGGMMI